MPLRYAEPAAEAYNFPLTIGHLLNAAKVGARKRQIIYRDSVRYSYADLVDRIGRLASVLTDLGLEEGMTVAVLDWDSHRYLEAYFAVPMTGAVLQTANIRLPAAQLSYTLQHAKAEIVLVHRDFFPLFEEIMPQLLHLKAVVAIMDGSDDPVPSYVAGEYEALSGEASSDYPFRDIDENAVATTFYTSGTTGDPKGVCFTHRQLVLHTLALSGPFGASSLGGTLRLGDVYMPLTPMFHVHAWGMPYVATMLGVTQIYPGRYEPEMICRLRAEHRISFSHCVPTVLRMVLTAAQAVGADLQGWRVTVGGAALTRSLYEDARAQGVTATVGYGMSEATVLTIARAPIDGHGDEELAQALTASGMAIPLVAMRIVDDEMRDVPFDGVTRGELVVRAPWLTPSYLGDQAASDRLWHDGWMHTQDVATIDADGQVRIRDRLKDVIKSGGEWIDTLQLEELVAIVPGVAAVSIIAVPDERWGERPLAVVQPAPGAQPTLAELNAPIDQAIGKGELTRYGKLDHFVLVDEFPKTSVGKIDKKLLRSIHANR